MSTEPNVIVQQASISAVAADAVVVNLFEGVGAPGGATGAVDAALNGLLSEAIADGEITGRLYETTVLHTAGRIPARRVVVVGLGRSEDFNLLRARRAAGAAARAARKAGAKTVATIVHGAGIGGLEPAAAARATVEGMLTGLYSFSRYRTRNQEGSGRQVESVIVVEHSAGKIAAFQQAAQRAQVMARATNRAREWTNLPPNALHPGTLAEAAAEVARAGGLELEVIEGEELLKAGMEALYAVGKGSEHAPRLIRLTYRGRGASGIDLALVGKGVTFDSGGLSLKPGEAMEWMKGDMAGAAAVLAAAEAV
ncbi:MAG TPA: M17 family peptidase N-terminal domain-containing protein, partial [Bacillota bacterium]